MSWGETINSILGSSNPGYVLGGIALLALWLWGYTRIGKTFR